MEGGGSSLWKVCSGREEKGKGFPWTPLSKWYFLFLTSSWGSIEEGKMSSLSERFHLRFPVSPGVNIDFPQPSQFPAVITEHLAQLQIIKQLNHVVCYYRRLTWVQKPLLASLCCEVQMFICICYDLYIKYMGCIFYIHTHVCEEFVLGWQCCLWRLCNLLDCPWLAGISHSGVGHFEGYICHWFWAWVLCSLIHQDLTLQDVK